MKKMALIMAMAVLVCWLPGQALADIIIMWDLSGVTFSGGGSATGDFTYDATTGTITSWDITANQGTSPSRGHDEPVHFSGLCLGVRGKPAPRNPSVFDRALGVPRVWTVSLFCQWLFGLGGAGFVDVVGHFVL